MNDEEIRLPIPRPGTIRNLVGGERRAIAGLRALLAEWRGLVVLPEDADDLERGKRGNGWASVATPEAWRAEPELVWRFYQERRAQLHQVEPSAAHRALHGLGEALRAAGQVFTLISQNVDDLHQRCGGEVLDMHGQLRRLACERCGRRVRDEDSVDPSCFVPCSGCGFERLRPDVVWFGEVPHHLDEIAEAVEDATHFLACGTSGAVYPAAGLLAAARARGVETFVNSLEEPDNLAAGEDTFWPGRAVEVLPQRIAAWRVAWGV